MTGASDDPAGHYAVLGIPVSASASEVRSAYLALARRHHPDRLVAAAPHEQAAADGVMSRINEAWSVLGDPGRRAVYDSAPAGATSGATIRDADGFRAMADDGDDWVDPRLVDDSPTGASDLGRPLTFLPVVLAVVGAGILFLGLLLVIPLVVDLGILTIVGAGLSFVLIPVVAMVNSSRADRR